ESYRALGLHVAEAVFAEAAAEAEGQVGGRVGREYTRELFAAVVRRWFAMPPEYEPSYVASAQGFIQVQETLCRNPLLHHLTRDLYPELFPTPPQPPPEDAGQEAARRAAEVDAVPQPPPEDPEKEPARHAAEVHAVVQMLQVMENAWLSLKLDMNYAHPLNRG